VSKKKREIEIMQQHNNDDEVEMTGGGNKNDGMSGMN
jgi:hypothetical protein